MSSPLIWIIYPLIFSLFLWVLRRYEVFVKIFASFFCVSLFLTGLLLPINEYINIGSFPLQISEELSFLGRRFVLGVGDRPAILFFYGLAAFYFIGTLTIPVNQNFVPIAMGMLALYVGAIAVEPFLYAALLIEVCVLLVIPIILWDRKIAEQGVLLYLVFQTLAMPLILLAGWSSVAVEANPADQNFLRQTVVLLGLGFGILLAVLPFHSWMPLFTRQNHPYISGFILTLQPIIVFFLALDFLNAYVWLRSFPQLFDGIRLVAIMMIIFAGIMAALVQDIGRMIAYALMLENGFALLSLSFDNPIGLNAFILSLVPRVVGLAVWALALSVLKYSPEKGSRDLQGAIRNYPVASLSLILSGLSFSGLPLLAGFPIRLIIFENLSRLSITQSVLVFAGILGFLVGVLQMIRLLIVSDETEWHIKEKWPQTAILLGGMVMLILFGVYPKIYFSFMLPILQAFAYLP